jgi:hypothetical protein
MRGFFVLLLFTNLLFLGWQLWLAPSKTEQSPYIGDVEKNEGLRLLSELEEKKIPPQRKLLPVGGRRVEAVATEVDLLPADKHRDENVADSVPEAAIMNCYQSTPMENLDEAEALQQSLVSMGVKESERRSVDTQKINYWLMFPAEENDSKVKDAVAILKTKRVKDFFVVRSGRYENAISLGVYSTRERAEQRYKEVMSFKLRLQKPVIEAIELPAKRLVVSFQLAADLVPDEMTSLLDDSKQPYLKKISCN